MKVLRSKIDGYLYPAHESLKYRDDLEEIDYEPAKIIEQKFVEVDEPATPAVVDEPKAPAAKAPFKRNGKGK